MLSRSIVVQSLRSIRDRFFDTRRQRNEQSDGQGPDNDVTGPSLDNLPVDMQFLIMTFLSPQDLCRLGGTSTYWRSMVRDPVLWKYFLLRDMPLWQSVDHLSVPQVKLTGSAVLDDSEMQLDYMAEYLRVCPACRNQWRHQPRVFESVTSFFQSLVPVSEPQFAMFGPGLEQLEISLMNTIMCSSHVLPVAGPPQRQIDGIGSGISFKYKDQHRFNIATLYSTNRSARERARLEHLSLRSKLFVYEEDSESNIPLSINPMFNQVCQAVNGFIFVVNAETERGMTVLDCSEHTLVLKAYASMLEISFVHKYKLCLSMNVFSLLKHCKQIPNVILLFILYSISLFSKLEEQTEGGRRKVPRSGLF
uniref:F-box protein 4 n=1 Tax=Cyprinus carpio TaxID=7962 RepID=A0A8C2BAS2_CYPCA